MWNTASQAAASKPVRSAAPYPGWLGGETPRTRLPGAAAPRARAAVSSVLPSSTTSTSKSAIPSAARASPVRRTVSAITASSLYAGSTALIVGCPRSAATGWGTSGSSTNVVDDDVVGARDDGKSLARPPGQPCLRVHGARIVEAVVDLDVADAVSTQHAGDRACRRVVRAPRVHGLDIAVATPEIDGVAPDPSPIAQRADATRDREDRVVGAAKGEEDVSLRGGALDARRKLEFLRRGDGVRPDDL